MEDYIKLYDFPVKGVSVKIEVVNFETIREIDHGESFFKILRVKDKYSIDFLSRSVEYTAVWNSLPGESKNDVLDRLVPINQITVNIQKLFGKQIERTYFDVFVVNYWSVILLSGTPAIERAKKLEALTFRSKKAGSWW